MKDYPVWVIEKWVKRGKPIPLWAKARWGQNSKSGNLKSANLKKTK